MVAWSDYKKQAQERGSLALELFVVVTTPVADLESVKIACQTICNTKMS